MVTDRSYRVVLGASLLAILYFDLQSLLFAVIGILYAEGLSNRRLPYVINRLLRAEEPAPRITFPPEAEQAWRLVVATMLLLTGVLFVQNAWFLPWFLGFAILGAGVSDICPVVQLLRMAGCRS